MFKVMQLQIFFKEIQTLRHLSDDISSSGKEKF